MTGKILTFIHPTRTVIPLEVLDKTGLTVKKTVSPLEALNAMIKAGHGARMVRSDTGELKGKMAEFGANDDNY